MVGALHGAPWAFDGFADLDQADPDGVVDQPVGQLASCQPDLPWAQIAGMRDRLAHRYSDTSHAIVQGTTDDDLPVLAAAVERLRSHVTN